MPELAERPRQSATGGAPAERDGIPILDLAGVLEDCARQLRHALQEVGFFFVVNHPVAQSLVDRVFAEAARFHALPLGQKMRLKFSASNTGYVPLGGGISRASELAANKQPNLNAAFFMKRDRAPDDPDVLAGKPHRGLNQWPEGLPGFRETLLEYFYAMEALGHLLLPIYARALDLPADYFAAPFAPAQITLRLSHYPPVEHEQNQFGLAPHSDAGFMTLLAQSAVPGLAIRMSTGDWQAVPAIPGALLVNSGDTLKRWTNDRFLSTPHRVANLSGTDRYAIPFFFDPNTDTVIECLASCHGPTDPPRHPPVAYGDYLTWFMNRNYHQNDDADGPARP